MSFHWFVRQCVKLVGNCFSTSAQSHGPDRDTFQVVPMKADRFSQLLFLLSL